MENSKVFTYQYSANQSREIERIRCKYLPKEENKMDTLRRLDTRAMTAGVVPSLCIGVIGSLIFGVGMCFFLAVFEGTALITAALMILGALIMLLAYPVYRRISRKTKEKLTPEILRLSEEIMRS